MPPKDSIVTDMEVQLGASISGMRIRSTSSNLSTFENRPARLYNISAVVDEIAFKMDLMVIERVNERPYIEKLDIKLTGGWRYELEPLMKQVEMSKEPTMWLLGLRSYCNEIAYRRDVWKWMKEKWGASISFPMGEFSNSVLVCTDQTATTSEHPKFLLNWIISFSPEGIIQTSIRPHFQMETENEGDQKKLDALKDEIVREFDVLLDVEGVEDAILFLMNCLSYSVC